MLLIERKDGFNGKEKNTQMFVIAILAVAVLTMSVGFAAFTQTLDISGNVSVASSSWNIQFDTSSYQESAGSVTVAADNRTISGTSMTYNVTLTKPGDFYEFTVNVKNTGTFDANLTGITMSPLTTEQSKYLTYEIDYNSNTYTSTQTGLSISLANTSGVVPVKVKVSYVQPENPADLPSSEVTIPLTASLTYNQA